MSVLTDGHHGDCHTESSHLSSSCHLASHPDWSMDKSHPDWVSMDIDKLGKSFYNSEEQPLNIHAKSLKVKSMYEVLKNGGRNSTTDKNRDNDRDRNREYNRDETQVSESSAGAETEENTPAVAAIENTDDIETTNDIETSHEISEISKPEIDESTSSSLVDAFIEYLRSTEGLVNNDIRQKVWQLLLGIETDAPGASEELSSSESSLSKNLKLNSTSASFFLDELNSNDLPPHKDEDQVKLDIQRSFTILNHIQSFHQFSNDSYTTIFSKADIDDLKKKLLNLIIRILRKHPLLNYYQGYHDIASIVLLVCHDQANSEVNEEMALKILEPLTILHLRDFMITDINLSINHLKLIPMLLEVIEPSLFELIKQSNNSYILSNGAHYDYNFFQGLSSILTFYSHEITNLQQILTIWDFIFSYDSVIVSVYLYVAALIFFKESIFSKLNIQLDDYSEYENVDCDLIHTLVSPSKLFDGLTDQELIKILNKTKLLISSHPIQTLSNSATTFDTWFKKFNKNSVLMNSSDIETNRIQKYQKYKYLILNSLNSISPESIDSLNDIMGLQDEEMSKQTINDISIQNSILEQQEELANSLHNSTVYDSSNPELISSSLSLTSTGSTINTKIMNTSSVILKKLFMSDSFRMSSSPEPLSEDSEKKLIKRNTDNQIFHSNIYRISFTIGFIGCMIHFLLIRNNPSLHNYNIFRYVNPSLSPFRRLGTSIINNESVLTFTNEVTSIGGEVFNEVRTYVQDSELVSYGVNICQVGLGNLRSTIYGFVG